MHRYKIFGANPGIVLNENTSIHIVSHLLVSECPGWSFPVVTDQVLLRVTRLISHEQTAKTLKHMIDQAPLKETEHLQ